MQRKNLSLSEILENYKKGGRDFSNIRCSSDFTNLDLKGIIFKNSDLSFSTFRGAQLQGADFSNSNLEWTDFSLANLADAKLIRANCTYSLFNDAVFDRADVRNADFSWSLLFNVNFHSANIAGANFTTAAFSVADITKEGLEHVSFMSANLRIPPELLLEIKFSVGRTKERFLAFSMAQQDDNFNASYQLSGAAGNYRVATESRDTVQYSIKNPYRMEVKYKS